MYIYINKYIYYIHLLYYTYIHIIYIYIYDIYIYIHSFCRLVSRSSIDLVHRSETAGDRHGRRWWPAAATALVEGRGGAGRDGRGGEGDETTVAKMNAAALLDEDEDEGTGGFRASARLYRGVSFSTGPWLEPVLKGL